MAEGDAVCIMPWGEGDLELKLLGDPSMMEHLGGPESPEKIADRQGRGIAGRATELAIERARGQGRH
ncbi:MAG: hypothetical protein H0U05_12980, partial [Actinobacteria bacterium]|nr:hypothetical protein [Actinomycetota bacterium]